TAPHRLIMTWWGRPCCGRSNKGSGRRSRPTFVRPGPGSTDCWRKPCRPGPPKWCGCRLRNSRRFASPICSAGALARRGGVGDLFDHAWLEAEFRRNPRRLGVAQGGAEPWPLLHAAPDQVGGLERKARRCPALRQRCKRVPRLVRRVGGCARPRQQHAIHERRGADLIEEHAAILSGGFWGDG